MKTLRLALLLVLWAYAPAFGDSLKLAVTTSFENAGLAGVLLPAIKADLDLDIDLLVVGTGQALRLGRAGDVDALLVHAPAAEDAFIASGNGIYRRAVMYNDFVLIGPAGDPAGVERARDVAAAFASIARSGALFASRGDDSGTHQRELALWDQAGIAASARTGAWYKATGSGMGATLNTASGLNAYVLADRASWLTFGNKGDLTLLFAGDPALFNQYSFLPVNTSRHPHVKAAAAARLESWLLSERAKNLINGYMLNGVRLFTFNGR